MFAQKHPDVVREEYICCGTHVRKFASLLAVLFFLINLIAFGNAVVEEKSGNCVGFAFAAFVNLLVLFGDKFEIACCYLPQILVNTIAVVSLGASILFMIVLLFIPALIQYVDPEGQFDASSRTLFYAVLIAGIVFGSMLWMFLLAIWRIFYRARNYLQQEVVSGVRDRSHDPAKPYEFSTMLS